MASVALSKPLAPIWSIGTARADAALTTSYVASSHVNVERFDSIAALLDLTWVDCTSIEWYVEWSFDESNWFRSVNVDASAGVNTITANSQTYAASASVKLCDGGIPVEAPFVRVAVKKTGGVGADSLAVTIGVLRLQKV